MMRPFEVVSGTRRCDRESSGTDRHHQPPPNTTNHHQPLQPHRRDNIVSHRSSCLGQGRLAAGTAGGIACRSHGTPRRSLGNGVPRRRVWNHGCHLKPIFPHGCKVSYLTARSHTVLVSEGDTITDTQNDVSWGFEFPVALRMHAG